MADGLARRRRCERPCSYAKPFRSNLGLNGIPCSMNRKTLDSVCAIWAPGEENWEVLQYPGGNCLPTKGEVDSSILSSSISTFNQLAAIAMLLKA